MSFVTSAPCPFGGLMACPVENFFCPRKVPYSLICLLVLSLSSVVNCKVPEENFEGFRLHYFRGVYDRITVETEDEVKLTVICNEGEDKSLLSIWKTVSVRIISPSKDYEVFRGENESVVLNLYKESKGFFTFLDPWHLSSRVDLLVYNKSCVAIHSSHRYLVLLEIHRIDFWKVLKFAIGCFLFFSAPYLSGNVVFYYSSGVALGIFASLLILIFILSRFIPKRIGAVSFLVGGWALVLYAAQLLFANIKSIIVQYQSYVLAYLLSVGFVSFAICYKRGHVTDVRTLNLIKWVLQAISLLFVFSSTEWSEAAVSLILVMLAIHTFPSKWTAAIRNRWRRRFPPKMKLLSEDEYYQQSAIETNKALEELRRFCHSPDCQSWKLLRRLNSPMRFAEFVEGNSHLTDDEMLDYETEVTSLSVDGVEFTDDESDEDYGRRHNGTATTF